MFIKLTHDQMNNNNGDDLIRCACTIASYQEIDNFINYDDPRTVLVNGVKCYAIIDYQRQ